MKKVAFVLLLTCVIIGGAFAQQKPAAPAPAPAPPPKAPAPAPAAPVAPASANRINAVGLDLFQLLKGFIFTDKTNELSAFMVVASYERLINPHFSIGADLDMYFYTFGSGKESTDGNYFSLAFEGRYYPLSENFDKVFIGATLGYSQLSVDGSTKGDEGGFAGLSTSLKIGYKYITANGLFLEPSMSYVLQKTSAMASFFGVDMGTPLGWNGGLRLGYAF